MQQQKVPHEALWNEAVPYLEKLLCQGLTIERIAQFCDVKTSTVQRWLDVVGPSGVSLIKVRAMLTTLGGDFSQITYETAEIGYTFDLLGHGVVTVEEAMDILFQGSTQSLYRVYRGGPTVKPPNMTIKDLFELYDGALTATKEQLIQQFADAKRAAYEEVRAAHPDIVPEPAEETAEVEPVTIEMEAPPPETPEPAVQEQPRPVPDTVVLGVASTIASVIPALRVLTGLQSKDEVRQYLAPLLGSEAMELLEDLFVKAVPENDPVRYELDGAVGHVAALLRDAAPEIHALFDDMSDEGALAREDLRRTVGPETFSVLAVELTAMRSRQAFEKAKKGAIN